MPPRPAPPEIVAHRGTPRERTENTLRSFARALELGADGVELDVHATRDGVAVVHHDPVPRAVRADGRAEPRPIAALTAREVAALRFPDGDGIPTLDALLDLLGARATAYVELKGRDCDAAVLATLARHPTPAAVHSFDHRAVRRVSAARPALRTGLLLSSYVLDAPALLRAAGARDLWQEWEWIDAALVDAVHAAGGRVVAWTANDPGAVASLARLGVDAICTDVPAVARAAAGGVAPAR
ncbi:MAG: Glycerophosphoryl diester phosphodiesterase [uncultured Gemmatimonadaceae bacterium]|uniref:Glycerophosphoryl diester phosphodiesterase n=1 Tax=uncultured Gemmatimonadaceae bacterium TaxID=246130 RepID=A0A6J4KSE2_9BACT|nr:MAG: Glycerophosphoryl diester phosphodiesterase [uncultured Gemmatimonadaceae bacterium]